MLVAVSPSERRAVAANPNRNSVCYRLRGVQAVVLQQPVESYVSPDCTAVSRNARVVGRDPNANREKCGTVPAARVRRSVVGNRGRGLGETVVGEIRGAAVDLLQRDARRKTAAAPSARPGS